MAQRVSVIVSDDLDGSDGADTIEFGFEGKLYEIDLNSSHYQQLASALDPYIRAARRVRERTPRTGGGSKKQRSSDLRRVRDWAQQNGHKLPTRGRIPVAIYEAYNQANPDTQVATPAA